MSLEFEEYKARKIVNVHRHTDPWFWDKYSAMPYIGCRSGCTFCYLRGGTYLGRRDPNLFDSHIRVKINAAERLRTELATLEPDVIACGDWQQPAEERYRLSRKMLEVVSDLQFPLLIIERSQLITHDLDLIVEINRRTWAAVIFSFSNLDNDLKRRFEPRSSGLKGRLQAMEKVAEAGIQVGTALMPVIPFVGDGSHHLEAVVRATRDHGGRFVLVGGLTMAGEQARRVLNAMRQMDPALEEKLRSLYGWPVGGKPGYSPAQSYSAKLGQTVRELCSRYGLKDRMPRYTGTGLLAVNKRIAEYLFLKMYDLELAMAKQYRIWAYRKAAWAVDELPYSIAQLYHDGGESGLRKLPGIGQSIAGEIIWWLQKNTVMNKREELL